MKLHPEDPRLTAYLFGELAADEAAAVERAAAADPAIRLALRKIERVQLLLADTLAPASSGLLPRQREIIRRSAKQADHYGKVVTLPSHRRSFKPWLVPVAAAAGIVLAVTILARLPSQPAASLAVEPPAAPAGSWDQVPMEIALLPAPAPSDPSRSADGAGVVRPVAGATAALGGHAAARAAALETVGDEFLRQVGERLESSPAPTPAELPELLPRGMVHAAETPLLELPVLAGKASLGWIKQSVREDRALPSPKAVRLEEILNAFPLRPSGLTAVSGGVTVVSEILPCPWRPSSSLVLVSIRGAADAAREVRPIFRAEPEAVRRYRLLGFSTLPGVETDILPSRLPAKAATHLIIEIEPAGISHEFGAIEWTVDGGAAAAVPLLRQPDSEPSDDARFAALVATFAQWLTGEQSGVIDHEIVAALAREIDSASLPPDRADFLALINEALGL